MRRVQILGIINDVITHFLEFPSDQLNIGPSDILKGNLRQMGMHGDFPNVF